MLLKEFLYRLGIVRIFISKCSNKSVVREAYFYKPRIVPVAKILSVKFLPLTEFSSTPHLLHEHLPFRWICIQNIQPRSQHFLIVFWVSGNTLEKTDRIYWSAAFVDK